MTVYVHGRQTYILKVFIFYLKKKDAHKEMFVQIWVDRGQRSSCKIPHENIWRKCPACNICLLEASWCCMKKFSINTKVAHSALRVWKNNFHKMQKTDKRSSDTCLMPTCLSFSQLLTIFLSNDPCSEINHSASTVWKLKKKRIKRT